MTTTPSPAPSPEQPHARSPRRRSGAAKAAKMALVAGVAAGASFAAVTGVSAASGTTASSGSSSATGAAAPAAGAPGGPGGPMGRPGAMGPHGRGGPGGPGAGGTITAINGSTLTLRTEDGTQTVDTSSTTTYTKERTTITAGDLHVGDVVRVVATRPSTSSGATTPPAPGTGTVDAQKVTVVEPTFAGRVDNITGSTYELVGRDGQLLTVTTTPSTRFYDGAATASSSAITVGSHVVAEGTQTGITTLTADVLAVGPARPAGPPTGGSGAPTAPSGAAPTVSG
ncbi:MAG TPA: DUF5666 domain-containing protein [Acidimicrobiales bacterium]|nr:DUF5666 domain-containing protein [Acidimicrobiales bacterium]